MHKSNCMNKGSTQIMHKQSLINIYHSSETDSYLFPGTTTRRVIIIPTSYSVNLFAHIWTFNINEIVWYLFFARLPLHYVSESQFILLSVIKVAYYHRYTVKKKKCEYATFIYPSCWQSFVQFPVWGHNA